jgi:asparagine synthase (glutamine-hydrolysing)
VCGICGLVSGQPQTATTRLIDRMSAVIDHRGPNDAGVWLADTRTSSVGLGHRRLSIVDLSAAGRQPMTNEDGSVWVVYNGEIYNHAEIRKDLEALGHRYRTRCDTETIVHAYEEWGEACVHRFRGMFAFALWDSRNQRLLLVRDRLGIKPLYWCRQGNLLLFGSEIKAILASGVIDARPADDLLPEYLMFGYLAGEETLFRGIRKLQPGHRLVWRPDSVSVERYWDVKFGVDDGASEAELAERFRSLFEESVRLHLLSDVPLGVFLSGGLDSSAIAAVMGRHVSGRIKTFSVGFEEPFYSEFSFARRVAEHIGSDHHEAILTAREFRELLPRMIWHEDEPLWAPPSVALYKVAELAAQSVTVVLTGEGSDELFAGYDKYWMSVWNERTSSIYGRLPAGVRRTVRELVIQGRLPERWRRALGHTILNHDRSPDAMVFDNWLGVFTKDMQQHIAGPELRKVLADADVYGSHRAFWNEAGGDIVDRMLYTDTKTNLVELLMKQDQMSMAASIESRVPFLDHHIVEFAAKVPPRYKLRTASGKRLVKKALAAYLPPEIIHRPKKGFPVPFESWLNNDFSTEIRETLLERRTTERGWFDPSGVRRLIEEHKQGRRNLTRQIWALWTLELWARLFLDGDRISASVLGDSIRGRDMRLHGGDAAPLRASG